MYRTVPPLTDAAVTGAPNASVMPDTAGISYDVVGCADTCPATIIVQTRFAAAPGAVVHKNCVLSVTTVQVDG